VKRWLFETCKYSETMGRVSIIGEEHKFFIDRSAALKHLADIVGFDTSVLTWVRPDRLIYWNNGTTYYIIEVEIF
jgi:hypothetical protein